MTKAELKAIEAQWNTAEGRQRLVSEIVMFGPRVLAKACGTINKQSQEIRDLYELLEECMDYDEQHHERIQAKLKEWNDD